MWRRAVLLLLAAILPIMPARAAPPTVTITRLGAPDTVFAWRRDRCDMIDTPDAPARAFTDAGGNVHLIAAHYVLWQMTGKSLDRVQRHCDIAFRSTRSRRYEDHRNEEWLTSFYTLDGNTVHALVHNEFHGADRAGCRTEPLGGCWWNSVTYAASSDGGWHFHEMPSNNRLVAALPYAYTPDAKSPAGYFSPTNIVAANGGFLALIKATSYRAQQAGSCLIRTADLADAASWRAWDGGGFRVRLDGGTGICAPIDAVWLGDVGGISRDESSGAFVAVSQAALPDSGDHRVCGIWAAASRDLVAWSRPVLVWADPASPATCDPASDLYPSLLDPQSHTRDFESFATTPYLYFVRADLNHPPYDRRLMRQRVRIDVTMPDASPPPADTKPAAPAVPHTSPATP